MATSASLQHGIDFLPSFALIRPSTFAVFLLVASTWIYLYARKALKYRVGSLVLEGISTLLLIVDCPLHGCPLRVGRPINYVLTSMEA